MFGELDRVVEQIDQHLPHPQRIADEVIRHGVVDAANELKPLLTCAVAKRLAQLVDDLAKV